MPTLPLQGGEESKGMIKFLRKIRKKLADDNHLFKYARYAIGEVVLVVLGILIALLINNWNEERNNDITEKGMLTNLKMEELSNILADHIMVTMYGMDQIN